MAGSSTVHAGSDSGQQSLERLDADKLRDEKIEGVSAFHRELVRMYDIYLPVPHDESQTNEES